jgi:hypothetical protein
MRTYTDKAERLERRVVKLIQSPASESLISSSIYTLFGNAALLHIYMFMRDIPRGVPFLNLLSNRIRKSLELEDLKKLEFQYPEMALWILMLGGLGGIGTENRAWFAGRLAGACQALGIRGSEELAFALKDLLWSELYLSPMTGGFWGDVGVIQGLEAGYVVRGLSDCMATAPFRMSPCLVWGFENREFGRVSSSVLASLLHQIGYMEGRSFIPCRFSLGEPQFSSGHHGMQWWWDGVYQAFFPMNSEFVMKESELIDF